MSTVKVMVRVSPNSPVEGPVKEPAGERDKEVTSGGRS